MKSKGFHTWFILGLVVLALASFSATGCKKKDKSGVSGTGGAVMGGDQGMGARAQAIAEAQSQLQTVYFQYDAFDLSAGAQSTLRENADVINRYPDVRIQIQGHCDERGSEEYNLALGDRRARAVSDYLVNLGITPSRLTTISFGEERPVDPGHDEAAWSRNRRGEFVAE